MRPFLIVLMLVFSHPVVAQTTLKFHNREVTVTLSSPPCTSATVLSAIRPEARSQFKTSSVLWQGKWLAACWVLMDDGMVLIVDEQREYILLPGSAFKVEPGV